MQTFLNILVKTHTAPVIAGRYNDDAISRSSPMSYSFVYDEGLMPLGGKNGCINTNHHAAIVRESFIWNWEKGRRR